MGWPWSVEDLWRLERGIRHTSPSFICILVASKPRDVDMLHLAKGGLISVVGFGDFLRRDWNQFGYIYRPVDVVLYAERMKRGE